MRKLILVTGGTGFIGRHLVQALVNAGKRIRCLVLPNSDITVLKKMSVEIVYGDVLDLRSLQKAVEGVEIVYHLAAYVRPYRNFYQLHKFSDSFDDVNVLGTQNLADVCCESHVQRFIFYSSIAVAGLGEGHTEASVCEPITTYGQSKLKAEKYLMALYESKNFPVVILRPGQVFGPANMPMLTLFRFVRRGVLPSFGPGTNRIPFCFVDNLIHATLSAESKGSIGSQYYIFDEHLTLRGFSLLIAEALGVQLSRFYIPKYLAVLGITLKELIEKVIRVRICPLRMDISSETIKIATNNWTFSNEKSIKELEYQSQISLKEGVEKTVQWYRERGYL